MGKCVIDESRENDSWLILGNSHLSKMGAYFRSFGAGTISIRGGGTEHAHELLKMVKYLKGTLECIVLLVTGNDLADRRKDVGEFATETKLMVRNLRRENPCTVVVTVSAIPRITDLDDRAGSSERFLERSALFDQMFTQQDTYHHHLRHDFFVGERTESGTLPLIDRYAYDNVHLNPDGLRLLEELFEFIFDCVNFNDYDRYKRVWVEHISGECRFAKWAY